MDVTRMTEHIRGLGGVRVLEHDGDSYFLYDPNSDLPPQRQQPFTTIITGDRHDQVSRLDRPDVWRLNIGLTRATYTAWFDPAAPVDFAALDTLMPHPVYAGHHFVCVLNPADRTLPTVLDWLAEAHTFAKRKHDNHQRRTG